MSSTPVDKARPQRTYRACYACRSRKLKCDLGDPLRPTRGPCIRCQREGRECVRGKPTVIGASKRNVGHQVSDSIPRVALPSTTASTTVTGANDVPSSARRSSVHSEVEAEDEMDHDGCLIPPSRDNNAVIASQLHNPGDALRLLATASRLRMEPEGPPDTTRPSSPTWSSFQGSGWLQWEPVVNESVTIAEAEALLSFFAVEMAPLYPVVPPHVLSAEYLPTLIADESLLLGCMVAIAARYSQLFIGDRGHVIHDRLSMWVRLQLSLLLDGETSLRTAGTVEALLLLSEWPLLPMQSPVKSIENADDADLLKPSMWYDTYSWGHIGWAVRLAQELGMHTQVTYSVNHGQAPQSWRQERTLRTWIYCFNADRHISVRMGRNAVIQAYMSSNWWEKVSDLASHNMRARGSKEVWVSDCFSQSLIACLIGTIQEHLYPNKGVTRSLLRTGVWESFLRSLRLELQFIRRSCESKLKEGGVDAVLLQIELDYVLLYANALALRALQQKLRRRAKAHDMYFSSPSLLNLVEGPWILEALSAAQSIIRLSVSVLEERGVLRLCPSRLFERILFAATFTYKALAIGVVEHGQSTVLDELESVINALHRASLDDQHFPRGFAVLLLRLNNHWRPPSPSERASSPPAEPRTSSQWPSVPADDAARFQQWKASLDSGTENQDTYSTLDPSVPFDRFGPDSLSWQFNPTLEMPAADRDQDVMFQSMWSNDALDPATLSLYATLLGN